MTNATIRGEAHATLISAPGSGQGKSMVTAAFARLHRNAGRKVRVFKHGPDYLDPMVQEVASGQPVYQRYGLVASYFHGYFPSAPELVAALFRGQPLWP